MNQCPKCGADVPPQPIRLQSLNSKTPGAYWEVGLITEDDNGEKIIPEIGVRFTAGPWISFRDLRSAAMQYENRLTDQDIAETATPEPGR